MTITATGLAPEAFVEVAQCVSALSDIYDDCDTADGAFAQADSDGNATLTLKVDAILTTGYASGATRQTDCRPSGACMIGLTGGDDILARQIEFDPEAPLAPAPTVTVSPDEDLTDYQTVSVTADGLVWANQAVIFQCAAADPLTAAECDTDTTGWVDTTRTDSFTEDFAVSTLIDTANHGAVDCREPDSCVLVVAPDWELSAPAKSAMTPLAFDPDGEVIPPTLGVSPDAGLVDGQTVTATGSGYRPGGFVNLLVCTAAPSWATCQWTDGFAEVDAAGSFTTDVEVSALFSTGTGEVDCRTSAEPCVLVATPGSSPESPRAGRVALAFDPDAPLLPSPEITVDPSSNLAGETSVAVTGRNFAPDGFAFVNVCQADDFSACDEQSSASANPDADGTFAVDVEVAAAFESWDGAEVDCRAEPGCVVVANDALRNRRATAPLSFAPPSDAGQRYLDAVFDDVDITHDVVYRDTVDSQGTAVHLTLDIYQPAGDIAEMRPAMVWMDGGWFSPGDDEMQTDMGTYADAFARRGYVAVTMTYRQRPELRCCPTSDAAGITDALLDGHEDAVAGLRWLVDHAADYRIDPHAIAAGGASAGAANSFSLAYEPDEPGGMGHTATPVASPMAAARPSADAGSPLIAAALPISGVSLGTPTADAPPVLAFHGSEDLTAPLHLSEWTCADAEAVGDRCDVVAYDGASGDIASAKRRDIVRRSSDFLAEVMLEPLGYLEPPEAPTTTTAPTTTAPTTVTTVGPTTTGSGIGIGSLPRTGSNGTLPLLRVGVALVLIGGGVLHLSRLLRRIRAEAAAGLAAGPSVGIADDGRFTAVGALSVVGSAVALAIALTLPHSLPTTGARAGAGTVQRAPGTPGQETPGQETPGDTTPTTILTTDTTTPPGDDTTTTIVDETTSTTTADGTTTSTTTTAPVATDPPEEEDDHGDHTGSGGDFPEDWTPEQVAYAQALIGHTEMVLPRFANPAILPLLGYTWIRDGTETDGFQHWVNLGRFGDTHRLDPEFPESLVFRNGQDGRMLEAAMFILPWGYDMTNIPDDIAWLPNWHLHDNLCFDTSGRLTGIAHDGICDIGFLVVTPPMLHVWTVDTPCGRFAGVDEHGLMCDDMPHH